MGAYGQSIPTKIYREFTRVDATKNQLWDRLIKMLDAVGMKYIMPASWGTLGYGADGGAFNYVLENSDTRPLTARRIACFDFPTTEYFTINGVQWRPFIYMSTADSPNNSYPNAVYHQNQIMFNHGLRRNTAAWSVDDIITWNKLMGRTSYNGIMEGGANSSTYDDEFQGFNPNNANWMQYAALLGNGSYPQLQQYYTIQHWYAYLGPSGLVLALGTADATNSQNKSTLFDVMNAMFLFGGARIPNRARMPVADVNLNRIDPIVAIPAYESGGFHNSGGIPYMNALAVGFDLKSSIADYQAVYGRIANLDNIDRPFTTLPSQLRPVPSPRVVGSVGRHILSRMVYMITSGYEVGGIDQNYCPVDADYNTSVNLWEDCWCCPEVRFTDNRAPIGLYTDPDTGVQWSLHYWNYQDVGVALKAVSPTILATLPSRSYGTATNYTFDITGSSIPAGNLTTAGVMASSPSRFLMVHAQLSTDRAQRWQTVAGQNYIEQTCGAFSDSQSVVYGTMELPSGADMQSRWQLQFNAFLRGGTENLAAHALNFDVYDWIRGWITAFTLLTSGANTGHANYNYTTRQAVSLPMHNGGDQTWYTQALAAGFFHFRLNLARTNAGGTSLVARVGDFKLISTPIV